MSNRFPLYVAGCLFMLTGCASSPKVEPNIPVETAIAAPYNVEVAPPLVHATRGNHVYVSGTVTRKDATGDPVRGAIAVQVLDSAGHTKDQTIASLNPPSLAPGSTASYKVGFWLANAGDAKIRVVFITADEAQQAFSTAEEQYRRKYRPGGETTPR